MTYDSSPALGVEVESKVDRDRANACPLALQDHTEPIALVAVPLIQAVMLSGRDESKLS